MSTVTIESKLRKIKEEGRVSPAQVEMAAKIIDAQYPEDIEVILGSSKSHLIVLSYYTDGITIDVKNFSAMLFDHLKSNTLKSFKEIDSQNMNELNAVFAERKSHPQIATIRAIRDFIDCSIEWSENWCILTHKFDRYTISVTVRPTLTAVELYDGDISLASTSGLDTTKSSLITGCIDHCRRMASEIPAENDKGAPTHGVSLIKAEETVPAREIERMLANLANSVNENSGGTFADGWKEALSAVTNGLSRIKSKKSGNNVDSHGTETPGTAKEIDENFCELFESDATKR